MERSFLTLDIQSIYTNRCETRDMRATCCHPYLYMRLARVSENLQLMLPHHNEGSFVSDILNLKHIFLNLFAAYCLRKSCMSETLQWETEKTKD